MIKLIFSINQEIFTIRIKDREIFYSDRKMLEETRVIPVDNRLRMKVINSRNKISQNILKQFELTPEEEKEYNDCNNEEELAVVCIKDAKKNGGILIKREWATLNLKF